MCRQKEASASVQANTDRQRTMVNPSQPLRATPPKYARAWYSPERDRVKRTR